MVQYQQVHDPQRLQSLIAAILLIESDAELDALLRHLVRSAAELVGAQYAAIGVLDRTGSHIADFITFGVDEDTQNRIGAMPLGHGLLGDVIRAHDAIRVDDLASRSQSAFPPYHPEMTNFLGTPVRTGDGKIFGNLYLANKRDGAFTDEDEAIVAVLGRATGLIIDHTQMREHVRSFTLLEERNRLARDLHDSVIQRLFAVGLSLQATLMTALPEAVDTQLNLAIDQLDATIREIRTTIFEITRHDDDGATTLRGTILRVVDEIPAAAALHVDISFDGPLDSAVGPQCREAVVMSLREMLSNVVRHAHASRAIVTVTLRGQQLTVTVKDNGAGLSDAPGHGRGTSNLTSRAHEFDGDFALTRDPAGGAIALWSAQKVQL